MPSNTRWSCAFALVACMLFLLNAGAAENDFQFRGGIKINKEFRKGFDLGLEYQVRLHKNAMDFKGSYLTLTPEYKLMKNLSVLAEVRYGMSDQWDRYRYGAGIAWKETRGKWRLTLQGKYQYETYAQSIPEIGQFPPKQNIRIKGEAGYKASKDVKFYASCEPRYQIRESEGALQRVKSTAGTEWEFIRRHSIDISYSWQPEYQSANDFTVWILEVTYTWKIPKAKKGPLAPGPPTPGGGE